MLPPVALAGYGPPPVRFPVGLRSFLCPVTHFLCLGLDLDLPLGFACPGYIYPFMGAVEPMTLSGWLLDPFPDSSEWGLLLGYGWVVYGSWVMVFLSGWA